MHRLPDNFPKFPEFSPGEVWLVGAGPGDPQLLTLLAMHALHSADVVIHDALVDKRILTLAREGAEIRFAGKRGGKPSPPQRDINEVIIALARAHKKVLRLKGGDPFVFGRGAEEALALSRAGVPFRIVPGLTSGLAAPALAGIPATTRETNHAIILATGHCAVDSEEGNDWAALARTGQPIVLYMAMSHLAEIASALQRGGLAANTPTTIITAATTMRERVLESELGVAAAAAEAAGLEPPAIIVIGRQAGLRRELLKAMVAHDDSGEHTHARCHPRAWPEDPPNSELRRTKSYDWPAHREKLPSGADLCSWNQLYSNVGVCGALGPRAKPEDDARGAGARKSPRAHAVAHFRDALSADGTDRSDGRLSSAPRTAPGLIIAAPSSGAGKTTIALGLMRALANRGFAVQPFKCGPDYIDPAFHVAAANRASFNLDSWAMRRELLAELVASQSSGVDICIAEGMMGLFDGGANVGRSGRGATADIAELLGWPVVLVLDVSAQAETAAAIALGCAAYRPGVRIAGVILNRVAGAHHQGLIVPALERNGLRVFGALQRRDDIALPERHLGLVQAGETADLDVRLERLAETVASAVRLEDVVAAALPSPLAAEEQVPLAHTRCRPPGQRIALARDAAFSFTYPHLIESWRAEGAEVLPFSPLADEAPDAGADVVWLPGGYPELHAGTLSSARRFSSGIRHAARRAAVHGECGGYMVLGQGIEDAQGTRHEMLGLLSLETSFAQRRLHLGYRNARLLADCALGRAGDEVLGHEFHYASVVSSLDEPLVACTDAAREQVAESGSRRGQVTGTFFHVIDWTA
jgi:cobyrinic acid a,c-diamide synthase